MLTAKAALKKIADKDGVPVGYFMKNGKKYKIRPGKIAGKSKNFRGTNYSVAELAAAAPKRKKKKTTTTKSKCIDPENRTNPCTLRLQSLSMDNDTAPTVTPCLREYKKLQKEKEKSEKADKEKNKKMDEKLDKLKKIVQKDLLNYMKWLRVNEEDLETKRRQFMKLVQDGSAKTKIQEAEYRKLCAQLPALEKTVNCVEDAISQMQTVVGQQGGGEDQEEGGGGRDQGGARQYRFAGGRRRAATF